MSDPTKARGRPKTMNRDEVVLVATMQYWEYGAPEVSINAISNILNVSKPGIYREFGSDDGLKAAALKTYQAMVIDPLLALLKPEQNLNTTLSEIISLLMQDRDAMGIPKSCLFVNMRANRVSLGQETLKVLDQLCEHVLNSFVVWIEDTKATGEFRQDIPSLTAAHQIDALHSGAMRMQKENVPAEEIHEFLRYGLAVITGEMKILSSEFQR